MASILSFPLPKPSSGASIMALRMSSTLFQQKGIPLSLLLLLRVVLVWYSMTFSTQIHKTLLKTSEWTVTDVDSDSIDALQVELSSTSGTLELTCVVSLNPLSMATAVIVKNNGRKAVNLAGAILTHFKLKRRNGAGVQGLKACSYCTLPLSSHYEILSPSEAMKSEGPCLFSFGWEPEKKPGEWSVQDVPITVLKHKLSRVYAAPPADRLKDFYNTITFKI